MKLIRTSTKLLPNFEQSLAQIVQNKESENLSALVQLQKIVMLMRPANWKDIEFANDRLAQLISLFERDTVFLNYFKRLVFSVFLTSDVSEAMTNSGISERNSVLSEVIRRIGHKILPALQNKKSVVYQINTIFFKKRDYDWIEELDNALLEKLFIFINLSVDVNNKRLRSQLYHSLEVLSYKMVLLGLERNITRRMGADGGTLSVFVQQNKQVLGIIEASAAYSDNEKIERLSATLHQCVEELKILKKKNIVYGTSMLETHQLQKMSLLADRMLLILALLSEDRKMEIPGLVQFFKMLVKNEKMQNSVRSYLNQTAEMLAYRISESGGNTGEHYITTTAKELRHLFSSAAKGGAFVSIIALLKTLIHYISLAPFWEAFGYGLNYAVGFIFLQAKGGTLATKQPAMTASTVASTLDDRKHATYNMAELAITLSKVMRSQLASLMGNVLVVFPCALAITFLWSLVFGHPLVSDSIAKGYLDMQDPHTSLCWWYAAIAGFFLFLSGILSGYFENYMVHGKIAQRLREHTIYQNSRKKERLDRLINYLEHNIGMLSGNFFLGFFLGFASFFGDIFGFPFDIRHVTFSTANVAFGLFGLGFHVSISKLIWLAAGIFLIGFFNLIVSFSLALYVAVKSRGVTFRDYRDLLHYLKVLFVRYPLDFVRAPAWVRSCKDLE
jgi:site-specific recombinase